MRSTNDSASDIFKIYGSMYFNRAIVKRNRVTSVPSRKTKSNMRVTVAGGRIVVNKLINHSDE
jgi:hypothetical protein